jgi:hypothetical protein
VQAAELASERSQLEAHIAELTEALAGAQAQLEELTAGAAEPVPVPLDRPVSPMPRPVERARRRARPVSPRQRARPAASLAEGRRRAAALARAREARGASRPVVPPAARRGPAPVPESRWLPAEWILGVFLLVIGLSVVALVLSGGLRFDVTP